MHFKALRHQPSDAARKSGYDNEGQLPDTLPDSRSRPRPVGRLGATSDLRRLGADVLQRLVCGGVVSTIEFSGLRTTANPALPELPYP